MFIEEFRRLKGSKSQRAFAEELGVSQSVISRLLSGEKDWERLEVRTVKKLCRPFASLREEVHRYLLPSDMPA